MSRDRIKKLRKRVDGKPAVDLRRKWRRWLPRLKDDVSDLYHNLQIYKELVEVVKGNEQSLDPPVFFNWMRNNYVIAICLGIRRLSDTDIRSVSIRILLDEVKLRPDTLTRNSYRALQYSKGLTASDADITFDSIVGKASDHISAQAINEDIARLEKVDKKIRRLVNKRLAHHAPLNQAGNPPTFSELEETLEVFDELLAKYCTLIAGDGFVTLYATPQYDWRKVLQFPWIEDYRKQRPPRYTGPKHPLIIEHP